ncbi:MAG: glutamate--tRNA ligase, partial [Elusimicrobia bacterium]|nr:glutamate--tRNA ligase [Elusimicrobiota bacterium]
PETMRNYLALLGWSTHESQQLFAGDELVAKFDLACCQKNPATFDNQKLLWMNGEYVRRLPAEAFVERALPFLEKAGLGDAPRAELSRALRLEQEKAKLLSDAPVLVGFFFKDPVYDPKAVDKVLRAPGAEQVLAGLAPALERIEPFTEKPLEEGIRRFCEERGLKPGQVFHPIRVAVSGRTTGPTLFGMLELLGRPKVLERFALARKLLAQAAR